MMYLRTITDKVTKVGLEDGHSISKRASSFGRGSIKERFPARRDLMKLRYDSVNGTTSAPHGDQA